MSYNISAIQGSTLFLTLNITNSDGTAYNLSGYNVSSKVKYRYSSTGYLLDLNPYIVNVTGGIISISGSATGMASLPCGDMLYETELTSSGGFVYKPVKGIFSVEPQVTS